MNIAICDDECLEAQTLKTLLLKYGQAQNLALHIDFYTHGEALLDALINTHYDIIFMDIYMGELNGIETIGHIDVTPMPAFIITTTSMDFAIDAFKVRATHYLVKPITFNDLSEAMNRCIVRPTTTIKSLNIASDSMNTTIPQDQITSIEVQNKCCLINTHSRQYKTYRSLESLAESLEPKVFFRCHRSFIVNLYHVNSFNNQDITLTDGTLIPLSRSNRDAFKEAYNQFMYALARQEL